MTGRGARPAPWLPTVACALLLLAALSGCGGGRDGGGGEPTVSSSPKPGTADLTIVVENAGTTTTHHLTCGPPGGDHPDPTTACRVLAERGERALAPVPKGMQCTQVYGGPQTAHITGTWAGRRVDSRFSLRDGCEIARWKALVGLLPRVGG